MAYAKGVNAFEKTDAKPLCMIDCIFNKDAVCLKGLCQLSSQCDAVRSVPNHYGQKFNQKAFHSEDFIDLVLASSSKGNQKKFVLKNKELFVKMQFNYQGRNWNDDLVEVIASNLGTQFNFYCVQQYLGTMDGLDCSYSKFFNGKFIAYQRIDLFEELYDYEDTLDQLKFAIACIEKKTGVDCSRYFYEMLLLDYLVCNEDRHLYNFGVLQVGDSMQVSPLFDFGIGLFEHDNVYTEKSLMEAEKIALKKPFGDQLPLIKWLEDEYGFNRPTLASLDNFIFPNKLAEDWLRQALARLEIKL